MAGGKRRAIDSQDASTEHRQQTSHGIWSGGFETSSQAALAPGVKSSGAPTLDVQRASSCLRSVHALNSQFARWVQQQHRERPDELWSSGVSDYVRHASCLMTEFKDVVEWLKSQGVAPGNDATPPRSAAFASSVAATSVPALTSPPATSASAQGQASSFLATSSLHSFGPSQPTSQGKAPTNPFTLAPTSSPFSSSPLSSSPFSSSPFSSSPFSSSPFSSSPFSSAFAPKPPTQILGSSSPAATAFLPAPSQLPAPPKIATASKAGDQPPAEGVGEDEEVDVEEPGSPSLRATEEPDVKVLHEARCKIFHMVESKWKDMGGGQVSLKEYPVEEGQKGLPRVRIMFRNEAGKLLLNAQLYSGLKPQAMKNQVILSLLSAHEGLPGVPADGAQGNSKVADASKAGSGPAVPSMKPYLLKLWDEEGAKKLRDTILENAPKP